MAKRLTSNAHVHNPDTNETLVLSVGDEVPAGFVAGDHLYVDNGEPEYVAVPGFGQVPVHELRRLQMAANGGQTDAEVEAQKKSDSQAKAQAAAARKRAEAAGSGASA
jgi:hypothetical protein